MGHLLTSLGFVLTLFDILGGRFGVCLAPRVCQLEALHLSHSRLAFHVSCRSRLLKLDVGYPAGGEGGERRGARRSSLFLRSFASGACPVGAWSLSSSSLLLVELQLCDCQASFFFDKVLSNAAQLSGARVSCCSRLLKHAVCYPAASVARAAPAARATRSKTLVAAASLFRLCCFLLRSAGALLQAA